MKWQIWGMRLGHHLGHVWASSGAYLGHHLKACLGQSKMSAVINASLMPFFVNGETAMLSGLVCLNILYIATSGNCTWFEGITIHGKASLFNRMEPNEEGPLLTFQVGRKSVGFSRVLKSARACLELRPGDNSRYCRLLRNQKSWRWGTFWEKQACKPRSYASPKLCPLT